jgi:hypothetical protein
MEINITFPDKLNGSRKFPCTAIIFALVIHYFYKHFFAISAGIDANRMTEIRLGGIVEIIAIWTRVGL